MAWLSDSNKQERVKADGRREGRRAKRLRLRDQVPRFHSAIVDRVDPKKASLLGL
jgi:hypothetical protein